MRLEAWYVPAAGGAGSMRLRLVNTGRDAIAGFELTFTSVVQLDPAPPASLVGRVSGCHVVAPPAGFVLEPGRMWELTATCGHRPGHANDGPASAFVTVEDGTAIAVTVGSAHRVSRRCHRPGDVPGRRRRCRSRPRRRRRSRRTVAPVPAGRARVDRRARRGGDDRRGDAGCLVPALGRRWQSADRGRLAARGRAGADRARAGGPRRRAAAARRARCRATSGAGCTSTWPASSSRPTTSAG